METLHAARNAMATRFEMVLHGPDRVRLRAAADEAFQGIERLHSQLSLYLPSSEVSFINAHAGERPVQVEPQLFSLLQLAQRIHQETAGGFDITIAPLMRCWGFLGRSGALPTAEQIALARAQVGMQHVILEEDKRTIHFAQPGMMIDLGSIGKGWALDVAVETLREAGIERALLHGGTGTVYALGTPLGEAAWKVAIDPPPESPECNDVSRPLAKSEERARPLAVVSLTEEALSVSAPHGKCFQAGSRTYGHILDPRTGAPAQGAVLSAVSLPSAAETDAFSTALLIAGTHDSDRIAQLRPGMRTLVAERIGETGALRMLARGIVPLQTQST